MPITYSASPNFNPLADTYVSQFYRQMGLNVIGSNPYQFVNRRAFKSVEVEDRTGTYQIVDVNNDLRRAGLHPVDIDMPAPSGGWKNGSGTFTVRSLGTSVRIPESEIVLADSLERKGFGGFRTQNNAMAAVMHWAENGLEQLCAEVTFPNASVGWSNTLVGTTDYVKFDNNGTDPIKTIADRWYSTRDAVPASIFDSILMTEDVARAIIQNTLFQSRMTAVVTGVNDLSATYAAFSDLEAILKKACRGLANVYICETKLNTSAAGSAYTATPVSSKSLLMYSRGAGEADSPIMEGTQPSVLYVNYAPAYAAALLSGSLQLDMRDRIVLSDDNRYFLRLGSVAEGTGGQRGRMVEAKTYGDYKIMNPSAAVHMTAAIA